MDELGPFNITNSSIPVITTHEEQDAKASHKWAGIPFNFSLNTILFIISIGIFTLLRKKANSNRSKNLSRLFKGWVQFIYEDREPQRATRQARHFIESHVHEYKYHGLLLSPSILGAINIEQEDVEDDQSIDRKEFLEQMEIEDIEDDDYDRRERKAEYAHRYMENAETEARIPLRQSGNWLFDIFLIRELDILQLKGRDAVEYLVFERYIIYFLFVLSVLCVFVILPINLHGAAMRKGDYFLKTTIFNMEANSSFLWIHVFLGIILYPIGAYLMYHFSIKIHVDDEDVCRRTLLIRRIPQWMRSKQTIIGFIQKKVPDIRITAIQLVYDIRNLSAKLLEYKNVVNAKYYCEDYFVELNKRFEGRPYIFGKFGGILCCCFCCPKVDGLQYYNEIQIQLERQIEEEYELCMANPKGAIFITFESAEMAKSVENYIKSHQYNSCISYCVSVGKCFLSYSKGSSDNVNLDTWIVECAPFPEDIIWSVIALDPKVIWFRRIIVYICLVIIFFFFSTPTILLQLAEGQFKGSKSINIFDKLKYSSPMLAAYLEPLTLILVGNILPAFVLLATDNLPQKTISSKNHSIMVMTFTFLILMIVILPSLGYTSTIDLLDKTLVGNSTLQLTRMITGSGSLFTNYIIQSAFISNAMELLRVSEVFVYFMFMSFFSSTIAEYESTRRQVIYQFQFGIWYSKIMLIVFIVNAYSLTCPLIAPLGLLYMLIKHGVDRYNIYFVYDPSRIDIRIHSAAIIFFHISLIAMQLRLISCLFYIESISRKTSVLTLVFIVEILLFSIQLYNRYFHGLFSFRKKEKRYFQEWCACSYIPGSLYETTTRGMVSLDKTSVRNQMKGLQVLKTDTTKLDNPPEQNSVDNDGSELSF